MALDICSKSGLTMHIGYGEFKWMREEVCNAIKPGLGVMYEWAFDAYHPYPLLRGIESKWNDATNTKDYEIPLGVDPHVFASTCNDLVWAYCSQNGFRNTFIHFLCHSDCDGKLTAAQCRRLAKELDEVKPLSKDEGGLMSENGKKNFIEFRALVREAAKRNETLFFH